MPITIKYPKNPNIDTAFVEQDDGTKNRALMIAPQDISTLELPNNPNSTKGYITVDGQKQRVILTADITGGGGGGSGLPDQTGHSGEFLTTDGTDASWSDKPLQNTATGTDSLTVAGTPTTAVRAINIGVGSSTTGANSTVIGEGASASANSAVAIGISTQATKNSALALVSGTVSGNSSKGIGTNISGNYSTGITTIVNHYGTMSANYTVAIGAFNYIDNLDDNSFYVGLGTSNADYKLLSSDGTIPTARFTTDPVADGTYYPTLTISSGTPTRSWSTISALQNTATGTDSLTLLGTGTTSQRSINIGVGSSIDSNNNVAIGHQATIGANTYSNVIAGMGATVTTNKSYNVAIGASSHASSGSEYGVAIGANTATAAKGAIQIGNATGTTKTNSDANTFKVGNTNGNYELMSADGTIPTARLTKVNSTITLTAAGWSGGSQSVSVSGVTSTSVVFVAPDPSDTADYVAAGILCTSQTTDSLTFTATTTPTSDIDVNIVCL